MFFLANAEDKTRGVAILFSNNCKFTPQLEHRDPEGRFLLMKGTIDDQIYSFISYYAPNQGQSEFFQNMLKKLDPLVEGTVIYRGDSNKPLDQGLDKSRPPGSQLTRPPKRSLKLAKLIFQYGLVDVWREMNPTKRDYTHFLCPYQSYARIDHIFISTSKLPNVTKSYIRDTVWSDHSIVLLILNRNLDLKFETQRIHTW